jgi:hypothetical protein
MKYSSSFPVLLGILLITACSPFKAAQKAENSGKIKTHYPNTAFDSTAARQALALGKVTIEGIAFTKANHKFGPPSVFWKRIFASNCEVVLLPVTPYLEAWHKMRFRKENKKNKVYLSTDAYRFRISTRTDEFGRFKFEQMKPGRYFLQVIIPWSEARSRNVYEGSAYGNYGTRFDFYSKQNYTVSFSDRVEQFVTIGKTEGVMTVKLK